MVIFYSYVKSTREYLWMYLRFRHFSHQHWKVIDSRNGGRSNLPVTRNHHRNLWSFLNVPAPNTGTIHKIHIYIYTYYLYIHIISYYIMFIFIFIFILCYIILYYIILFYIILYYIILSYLILYYIIYTYYLYIHIISYYIMVIFIFIFILCYIILSYYSIIFKYIYILFVNIMIMTCSDQCWVRLSWQVGGCRRTTELLPFVPVLDYNFERKLRIPKHKVPSGNLT